MGVTAIFGGTFNPPHIGHYEMMSSLEKCPEIDEILVIPTRIPPHKICDFLAGDTDRIFMCRELISDFKKAKISLIEFDRCGKSYTFDTVTQLKNKYPGKQFSFVCGGDMITSFNTWYKADELMKLLPFIVFRRADIDQAVFNEKIKELRNKGMKITVMDEVITAVSSSLIRNNIKECQDLLPVSVRDYIKSEGIYNGKL